jgi:GT2 family glycosyltransferase
MGIRRSVLNEIGLLDEDFFMEFDDHDLCWRARLAAYKVVVVTDSIIYHVRGGVTGPTLMTRRLSNIRRYTQNHLSAMIKNYEFSNVIKYVPLASILEAGKALWFGAKGSWPMARATLEGIIAVPLTFRTTWKKRMIVQSGRKLSDRSVLDNMLKFSPSALKVFYQYQTVGKRPFLSREELSRMRR